VLFIFVDDMTVAEIPAQQVRTWLVVHLAAVACGTRYQGRQRVYVWMSLAVQVLPIADRSVRDAELRSHLAVSDSLSK
jgi:hypothetical protein